MTNREQIAWSLGFCDYDNRDVAEILTEMLDAIDVYMDKDESKRLERWLALNCDPETNNWGIPGKNGGNLKLTGIRQKLIGNISCDAISTVSVTLSEDSVFTGAIDPEHTGKTASIQLDDSSTWNVTEDSYVAFLGNTLTDCSNINSNGHTIYYDSSHPDSKWLNGGRINLPGNGQLVPL